MDFTPWLPYIAVAISIATFISAQLTARRSAALSYVQELERRLDDCIRECREANSDRERLLRENIEYARRLAQEP